MLLSELPKVDLIKLHQHNPECYPFLLESRAISEKQRQYSILFTHPQESLVLRRLSDFDFLAELAKKVEQNKLFSQISLPFIGGYFVYLSYELIAQIEKKLAPQLIYNNNQPLAYATRINSAIIIDHHKNKTYWVDKENNQNKIKAILKDIKVINSQNRAVNSTIKADIINKERQFFTEQIVPIKAYIQAGDVFQVNLSRAWQIKLRQNYHSAQIYEALQHSNPAPFSALVSFLGFDIISSSPERLFQVKADIIQTRPIAGTRPRGLANHKDQQLQQELLSHPKERAEHIMLVDLERNDLGKICQHGTIIVDELMVLESYPAVHHIVSNIRGRLKKNAGCASIIRAIFPGGTITGCPKIRCMEIIAQLEQISREAYTGSLGYISDHGSMDFNILIRSLSRIDNTLNLRTGAGIVHDSNPEKEADETEYKAQAILKIFSH